MTERRKGDGEHIQAVIEIHSEQLLGDQPGEILIGCRHHAHIDVTGIRAAQPFKLLLLQDAQQFRLQFERNVADFIQEQRAAVRRLETAQLLRHGAREGALFMTEELTFQESQRNRRAVQLYERPMRRLLLVWMACAMSSLPVPVSPSMRTVESVGATVRI